MIELQITWCDPEPGLDGVALGWGSAMLVINGAPVWFGEGTTPQPLAWSWIELLEFLATKWAYLTTEQSYPMNLMPDEPRNLRKVFALNKPHLDSEVDRYDEEIFRFEGRHDLSRALRGISVPSVFIVREGNDAWVTTDDVAARFPMAEVVHDLEAIGRSIAARLVGNPSRRAEDALKAWNERQSVKTGLLIRLVTGIAQDEFQRGLSSDDLKFWELEDAIGADSEIASAARMMKGGFGSAEDRFTIINAIRQLPKADTSRLDEYSSKLLRELRENPEPYEEGYDLAGLVRSEFQISDKAEPDRILEHFGVRTVPVVVSRSVDAVGCWGPKHGPAIVINRQGKHASTPLGCRATLAHELCHLLVDRARSLPLAEVLGGKSPYRTERRANAFAAELLLPRWAAKEAFKKHRDVGPALDEVRAKYAVSKALAAAQLKNSNSGVYSAGLTNAELKILDRIIEKDELD